MHAFARKLTLALAAFTVATATLPHRIAAQEADGWYDGASDLQERLANGLERTVTQDVAATPFHTGSSHFDSEWIFATYMMAGMGFGQLALERPERAGELSRWMDTCIEGAISEPARAFDKNRWNEDPLTSLSGTKHHVAYLGYLNLLLGLRRLVDPRNPYADLNDRISAALDRRLSGTDAFLESFPGVVFPVDNASAIGSLGLHQEATRSQHSAVVKRFAARVAKSARTDRGLLVQIMEPDGTPVDGGRGSGTFFASYFLSFADEDLSKSLYESGKRELYTEFLGFGAMREYARDEPGRGDIDSGPVVLGLGVSSSGFALGPARMHGDRDTFRGVYATAHLFGVPVDTGNVRTYATGGPIGDAILFAMLTARRTTVGPTGARATAALVSPNIREEAR